MKITKSEWRKKNPKGPKLSNFRNTSARETLVQKYMNKGKEKVFKSSKRWSGIPHAMRVVKCQKHKATKKKSTERARGTTSATSTKSTKSTAGK